MIRRFGKELTAVRADLESTRARQEAGEQQVAQRFADSDELRAEVIAALESVRDRVQSLEVAVERHFQAVPYTAGDRFAFVDAPNAGRVLGLQGAAVADGDAYVAFEDVFRGPEERIRDRQRPYLAILDGRGPVLDVGCGRGEFLDLLREAGIPARGVDTDEGMAARARAKGLEVETGDGVALLESLDDGSLGAIFSAQVIEHLPVAVLERFVTLAARKLRPGGLFIAETVNPHAADALKGFWLDLTHQHPIFPEVALVLCGNAGFAQAYVFHPNGTGDAERDRWNESAYAVVAATGGGAPLW
jgi:SAM-dependent methyltransferase